MPLSEEEISTSCSGIADESFEDLNQIQDRIEAFLREVLPLCIEHLPGFADGAMAQKNEVVLVTSLCKWLQGFAQDREVLFAFFHEDPDAGGGNRTDDMSVTPAVGTAFLKVGPHYYSCEEQLYIIEAKRLPPPTGITQGDRSREYVVGNWQARDLDHKQCSGGIERFKEGRHGSAFRRSGMIAFVQSGTFDMWLATINSWVDDLVNNALPSHTATWVAEDCLTVVLTGVASLAEFTSNHGRATGAPIALRHFWLLIVQGKEVDSP